MNSKFVNQQTVWQRFKSRFLPATNHDLEEMEKRILVKSTELEAALNNQATQIGKIAKEQSDRFDALTLRIKELTEAVEAADVPEAVTTALAATQTALDSLDAAIPDAPPA